MPRVTNELYTVQGTYQCFQMIAHRPSERGPRPSERGGGVSLYGTDTMSHSNAIVKRFKRPSFNLKEFLVSPESNLAVLEDASHKLDQELNTELSACHEELLQSAGDINLVEDELSSLAQVVSGLSRTLAHLKTTCSEPFQKIKHQVVLLKRMHDAQLLLRKLYRFVESTEKLRQDLDGKLMDYAKAAATLHELEKILDQDDFDLTEVQVLIPDITWVKQQGRRLKQKAAQDLRQGITSNNQIQISVATQAFFNLNILWSEVQKALDEIVEQTLLKKLNLNPPSAKNIDDYLNLVISFAKNGIHPLDSLLSTKVDSFTHRSFADDLAKHGVSSAFNYFWDRAIGLLSKQLNQLRQEEKTRRQVVSEYPNIAGIFLRGLDQIRAIRTPAVSKIKDGSAAAAAPTTGLTELNDILFNGVKPIKEAYLKVSFRRVTQMLESLFANGEFPQLKDLQRYVDAIIMEYAVTEKAHCIAFFEQDVVRNVRHSLAQVTAELERRLDPEGFHFGDSILPGHKMNSQICETSHCLMQSLRESRVRNHIGSQLHQLYALQQQIICPLLEKCLQEQKIALEQDGLEVMNTRVKAFLSLYPTQSLNQFLPAIMASLFHHFLECLMSKWPREECLARLQAFEAQIRIIEDPEMYCAFETTIGRYLQHLYAETEYANLPSLLDLLSSNDLPDAPIFENKAAAFRAQLEHLFAPKQESRPGSTVVAADAAALGESRPSTPGISEPPIPTLGTGAAPTPEDGGSPKSRTSFVRAGSQVGSVPPSPNNRLRGNSAFQIDDSTDAAAQGLGGDPSTRPSGFSYTTPKVHPGRGFGSSIVVPPSTVHLSEDELHAQAQAQQQAQQPTPSLPAPIRSGSGLSASFAFDPLQRTMSSGGIADGLGHSIESDERRSHFGALQVSAGGPDLFDDTTGGGLVGTPNLEEGLLMDAFAPSQPPPSGSLTSPHPEESDDLEPAAALAPPPSPPEELIRRSLLEDAPTSSPRPPPPPPPGAQAPPPPPPPSDLFD